MDIFIAKGGRFLKRILPWEWWEQWHGNGGNKGIRAMGANNERTAGAMAWEQWEIFAKEQMLCNLPPPSSTLSAPQTNHLALPFTNTFRLQHCLDSLITFQPGYTTLVLVLRTVPLSHLHPLFNIKTCHQRRDAPSTNVASMT